MANIPLGTFLSKEELSKFEPQYELVQLIQTETYNEYDLSKSIELIGKDLCGAVAIQLAIVGYGNKSYGSVKYNDKIVEISSFFKENGVRIDTEYGSKLKPSDITPRRLIRFFRFTIDKYIKSNIEVQSYLFKKYCLNKNQLTRSFIYPGFEHIADPRIDSDKIEDLLKTYEYLDSRLGTRIKDRIVRVLIARGFNSDVFVITEIR